LSFPTELVVSGSPVPIELRAGLSTIVVGANGSGKTQLAVECERLLGLASHRISAQRMLAIDPSIEKVNEQTARALLRFGYADPSGYGGPERARASVRWGNAKPRFILDDAGALLQVLFGEQANTAVKAFNAHADGGPIPPGDTTMRKLRAIFRRVLPNRDLQITADDITVLPVTDGVVGEGFSVTQMSDGEKAVLYMIGQTLVADEGSVFIMDEPEIHIHRSILGRLWDELETARPDCAFLLITHDLEFAASRAGKKYVVQSYDPATGWVVEPVPEADGFSEDLVTLILGSRKPILFVEGESASLDVAFYRACYPAWTVVPRGSCEEVIHSVVTMRRNDAFTRIQSAGLVDADSRSDSERAALTARGIETLPVSEIENLLLLPAISRAILEMNDFGDAEIEAKLAALATAIFDDAKTEENIEEVVLRHCRRRIDNLLKQIDFSTDDSIASLASSYSARTAELDVFALATEIRSKISDAVDAGDLAALLAIYDRKKPLLALASAHLRNSKVDVFSAWTTRAVNSSRDDRLRVAVTSALPKIVAA